MEHVELARPAPPRLEGSGRWSVGRGRGGPFIHSWPLRRRRRHRSGRAGSRSPREVGCGGGARRRAFQGVGYVFTSAREREREEPTGDGAERGREGVQEQASV